MNNINVKPNQKILYAKKFDQVVIEEVIEVLDAETSSWWIDHGTLLGFIRDKNFIEWDKDIDIGLWNGHDISQHELCTKLQKRFEFVYLNTLCNAIRVVLIDGQDFWFIDIVFYKKENGFAVKYWPDTSGNSFKRRIVIELENLALMFYGNREIITKNKIKQTIYAIFWQVLIKTPDSHKNFLYEYMLKIIPIRENRVPSYFFEKIIEMSINGYKVKIPAMYIEYLQFRYGTEWHVPKPLWNYITDDGGLNP